MPRENPFKPAADTALYIKAFLFGDTGSGKTHFGLNAPGKVAMIDTEGGSTFFKGVVPDFDVLSTKSFKDVIGALDYIEATPGSYGTVIIDPISVVYETLQDAALKARVARNSRANKPTEDVELEIRDWGTIKRNLKTLMNRLANARCHVIVIAREKDDSVLKGGELIKNGVKPDAEKSTAYYFDVVLHTAIKGEARIFTVRKARGVLGKALPLGSQYTDPTFESLFGAVIRGEVAGEKPAAKGAKAKPKAERVVPTDESASSKDAVVFGEEIATAEMVAEFVMIMDSLGFDAEEVRARRNWPPFTEMPAATLADALAKVKAPKPSKAAAPTRSPEQEDADEAAASRGDDGDEYMDADAAPSKATN